LWTGASAQEGRMGSEGGWWKRIRLYRQGMVSVKREEGGDFSLGRQSGLVGDHLQISVWTFFFFFRKSLWPIGRIIQWEWEWSERASVSCHAPRPIVDCVPSRRGLPACIEHCALLTAPECEIRVSNTIQSLHLQYEGDPLTQPAPQLVLATLASACVPRTPSLALPCTLIPPISLDSRSQSRMLILARSPYFVIPVFPIIPPVLRPLTYLSSTHRTHFTLLAPSTSAS
jgi:hypothetical protein